MRCFKHKVGWAGGGFLDAGVDVLISAGTASMRGSVAC